MDLFGNSRKIVNRDKQATAKPQASATDEGNTMLWRRWRELVGAVLNRSLLEKGKHWADGGFWLAELQGWPVAGGGCSAPFPVGP